MSVCYILDTGPTTDLHGHTTTNAVNSSPSFGSSTEGTPTNAKLQQGEISLVGKLNVLWYLHKIKTKYAETEHIMQQSNNNYF